MPDELVDFLAGLNAVAAVFLAVSLFAGSLVPWLLLVDADFAALWRRLLAAVEPALAASREAARDAAALVVLLTTRPKGAMA